MKDNFNFIKNQTKEEGREIFSAIKKLEEYRIKNNIVSSSLTSCLMPLLRCCHKRAGEILK